MNFKVKTKLLFLQARRLKMRPFVRNSCILSALEIIILHTHDPGWEKIFAGEKELLIDIAVKAAVFPPAPSVIEQLSSIGYEYRGEAGIGGRHWFTKGSPRKVNLHYCALNSPIVKSQLAFRDSLIRSERLRREYEQVKIKNSEGKDIDDADYAQAKSPLIGKTIGQISRSSFNSDLLPLQ